MLATLPHLERTHFPAIRRDRLETLQVNLGYRCNQRCLHCHVNAGPNREEVMSGETVDQVLGFIERAGVSTLDLTGGAPELNPHFRRLVAAARGMGLRVIDRCNLTVLEEAGQEDLAEFLAGQEVEIVASLPCYLEENVDGQRGAGVFEASIRGLRRLNALGYGIAASKALNLVYNPQEAALPPPQEVLEADYKKHLWERYGVRFDRLYTLANMPIQRFGSTLLSRGEFDDYMQLLRRSFQEANLESVMCRTLASVDWRGFIYDCDFNQMLGLGLEHAEGGGQGPLHIGEVEPGALTGRPVVVRGHCYGCTAGQGSSCGGALA